MALLSPFIERSVKQMNYKTFTSLVIVTTLINIFLCYFMKFENRDGYTLLNFIYLYYLARYVRVNIEQNGIFDKSSAFYFKYYVISSVVLSGVLFLLAVCGVNTGGIRYFSYNNPIILISSLCLFLSMACAKSKKCNNSINLSGRSIRYIHNSIINPTVWV